MEPEPTTIVHATAIVHADGGTRYTTSRSHRRSGGVGQCTSTSCCRRHPRACTRVEQAASSRTSEAAHSRRVMLRDDLFLDSRDAAPAVVRSYEACEPEAQLRLRLRGTLNATLAARRVAVAAPLPILAVIYFGTHHERLHAVRAYERYFRRLVYMSPSREIVRAVSELRSRGGSSGAEVHAHHCTRWIKATYMCLASVAPALMDGLRGALYMHFDLWLQPWSLRTLPLDAVWSLPRHRIMQKRGGPSHLLPLHCFDASDPAAYTLNASAPTAWTWARDLPAAREATRA
eukprot:scaffold117674_cov72-Phaeocystis_antarctica.AAC.2